MRNIILFLLSTVHLFAQNPFDNPTVFAGGKYGCETHPEQYQYINTNRLEPVDCKYYYRLGDVDYDSVYSETMRIYIDEAIKAYKSLDVFNGVEFIETQDSAIAHFDFRIGDNIGIKAPLPPVDFSFYTIAYTWGVYEFSQPYFNQIWYNYNRMNSMDSHIVATIHEMGHRCNIAHSDVEQAIMYAYANKSTPDWHSDDIQAFDNKYNDLGCDGHLNECAEVCNEIDKLLNQQRQVSRSLKKLELSILELQQKKCK